jgi:hypothetical protein
MVSWETRKRAELAAKLRSVEDEHQHWLDLSAAGRPMEKHQSQVRAITDVLRPVARLLRDRVSAADVRAGWRTLEREVLDLHHVWGFFRDKWALRRLDEYRQYLVLADEFAWACYQAAQVPAVRAGTVALNAVRQPPLVYLGPVDGPLTLARGDSAEDELRSLPLQSRTACELVRQLPLPVVAVPWYQLLHLPEALIIGHEVGHLVVVDFLGLAAVEQVVDSRLAELGANDGERTDWQAWAEEAFADVYGVLCGGPAYAHTLADLIVSVGAEQAPDDRSYPPAALRLALTAGALAAAGCEEAARRVKDSWAAEGVPVTDAGTGTAEAVGAALVRGPYQAFGPKVTTLDQVVTCTAQCALDEQPQQLLNRWKPKTREIRTLLAVTAEAFRTAPEKFAHPVVQANILERAALIQQPGTRYRGWGPDPGASPATDPAQVERLYALLTGGR